MRQRFHPTSCRRTLTLLGFMGLAALLVWPGGIGAADDGAPPGEQDRPTSGPIPEVSITVKDQDVHWLGQSGEGVVPHDLIGVGASVKVRFGAVPPTFFNFLFVSWNFISFGTRVFITCNEGGYFNGAVFTVHNVIPVNGGVSILLRVQATYAPVVVCDVLAIN
jgi:hypothetical protein